MFIFKSDQLIETIWNTNLKE